MAESQGKNSRRGFRKYELKPTLVARPVRESKYGDIERRMKIKELNGRLRQAILRLAGQIHPTFSMRMGQMTDRIGRDNSGSVAYGPRFLGCSPHDHVDPCLMAYVEKTIVLFNEYQRGDRIAALIPEMHIVALERIAKRGIYLACGVTGDIRNDYRIQL